jgi:hypothetical protein
MISGISRITGFSKAITTYHTFLFTSAVAITPRLCIEIFCGRDGIWKTFSRYGVSLTPFNVVKPAQTRT